MHGEVIHNRPMNLQGIVKNTTSQRADSASFSLQSAGYVEHWRSMNRSVVGVFRIVSQVQCFAVHVDINQSVNQSIKKNIHVAQIN